MGKFANEVRGFLNNTRTQLDQDVRGITLALFKSVILSTPVDTGRARGNWQVSIGGPLSGTVDRLDKSGNVTIADAVSHIGGAGTVTWMVNNLPYIEMLEYGGYPDGPKTTGGYSKQAPAGMVRVNMARIGRILASRRALK